MLGKPKVIAPPPLPPELRFLIPAWKWNRLIDWLIQERPVVLDGELQRTDPHPWATLPAWNAAGRHWEASVSPGLVNALPPRVRQEDGSFLDLQDAPAIPIRSFRRPPAGAVPPWIRANYPAAGEPEILSNLETGVSVVLDTLQAGASHTHWAADLYVTMTRPTVTAGVDARHRVSRVIAGAVSEQATLSATSADMAGAAYDPPAPLDLLRGGVQDNPFCNRRVCTVWLISPPGAPEDAEPDATFTPLVEYGEFYNLTFDVALPDLNPEPLAFPGLAVSAVGADLISALLDDAERLASITDFLSGPNTIAADYYTA